MTERYYGWRPQLPDFRDNYFLFTPRFTGALPSVIDLRSKGPTPYDQKNLGACTGNGIARVFQFDVMKQNLPLFMPSRLFIYYNERVMEGTVRQDSGANVRDGMKSVANLGVCSEVDWAYIVSKFATRPTAKCYANATKNKSLVYRPVGQDLNTMKSCLAEGFPIVLGASLYSSFENDSVASTGVVPMPRKNESIIGGHCFVIEGALDSVQRFICCNSWGTDWGEGGYFSIPYSYLLNPDLASDLWMIETIK